MKNSQTSEPAVPVEREFFTEMLPRVRDLAELKLTLHAMYAAALKHRPAVPLSELLDPAVVHSVVGDQSPEPGPERLQRALERALANGLLLRLTVERGGSPVAYVLAGTARNRDLLHRLRMDEPSALRELDLPDDVEGSIYRPNVFSIYERHVGPLTPLIAEQLREAERAYPRAWIEQAILEAVRYNKRSWRYVESILTQWEENGAPDRPARELS